MSQQAESARGGDSRIQPFQFGGQNEVAPVGQAVVAAALVVGDAGLLDQLVTHHALQRAVEGSGAQAEAAALRGAGILHDEVAVLFSFR